MKIIPIQPIRAVTADGFTNVNALTINGTFDDFESAASVRYSIGVVSDIEFKPVYHGEIEMSPAEYQAADWTRAGMVSWVCKKLDIQAVAKS